MIKFIVALEAFIYEIKYQSSTSTKMKIVKVMTIKTLYSEVC